MEQAAAEAQAAATREFVGVREAREATLKGLQQEYGDAVDAQALQSGEKLQPGRYLLGGRLGGTGRKKTFRRDFFRKF